MSSFSKPISSSRPNTLLIFSNFKESVEKDVEIHVKHDVEDYKINEVPKNYMKNVFWADVIKKGMDSDNYERLKERIEQQSHSFNQI